MSRFQHTDGHIIIHNLAVPYDWFIEQEPNYSVLPENCIGRIYIPHKRHHLTMLKGETPCQCEGEHENHVWAEGDSYIAKYADYVEAYNLYLNPPPTPEEQAELDATQYQRDRALEYPPIGDQLDALWKEREGDPMESEAMLIKIKAIKDKYPKP